MSNRNVNSSSWDQGKYVARSRPPCSEDWLLVFSPVTLNRLGYLTSLSLRFPIDQKGIIIVLAS